MSRQPARQGRHSRCSATFVTSANLIQYALDRNIELGLWSVGETYRGSCPSLQRPGRQERPREAMSAAPEALRDQLSELVRAR